MTVQDFGEGRQADCLIVWLSLVNELVASESIQPRHVAPHESEDNLVPEAITMLALKDET
eukprot:CAMPEP_0185594514 /NCGR_PEP_ID=MMETSP0434-20130131/75181_1 /TAXON_ID=626734 ORGANISM="Favella taraikaensis, Strain Fe Narragansett Bay" /NCGR_SAMPLE_ID=MMETSP0434 /ASSEMBLY_ACC=CAM_ASM_000379 /LENGTH=59 /DNA_ID=CAMNT_0028221903 /DNA_START=714 /DNA_END=893 /DNA_ORIENTATION=-